jgi:hypothetical protein
VLDFEECFTVTLAYIILERKFAFSFMHLQLKENKIKKGMLMTVATTASS